MKQVLIAFFTLILGTAALGTAALHAQTLPGTLPHDSLDITTQQAVAFVKAETGSPSRSVLYIKQPNAPVDRYDLATIVNQLEGFTIIDSIRHLAVIGMTPKGDRLILGAEVTYYDQTSGNHPTFAGILQIPWPLTQAALGQDFTALFLQAAPDLGSFHPQGILSPDGTQWYATMRTSSQGDNTMDFYHGHTSGGTVDSAEITGDVTGTAPPQSGWNLSNLALDTTNGTMVASEVDGITSGGTQSQRIMLMHWQPGATQAYANDISGKIRNFPGKTEFAIDSLFDLTVSAVQNNSLIRFGLRNVNLTDGTVEFFTTSYNNANDPLNTDQTIPSSILPAATTFFAGENSFAAGNTPVYSDDNPNFIPHHGQGGDMILTNDGSTALFITHEVPDYPNTSPGSPRNVKSAIFSYDFSGSQTKMLYNDSNAQELQPVFVPSKDTTPHVPDIQANVNTLNFGTVDTGSISTPQTLTITDPSMFDGTILDSAKITGDNEFTIVSPKFPDTIEEPNRTASVQIHFSPVATAGTRTATLKIYSAMSATTSLSVTLNGTAKVLPAGEVNEDAALAQSMSIEPNPFSSIASVRLTAQDAGTLGIVVHDALGRTVYTSPVLHVGSGASETFDFDAKSLGLPNGIYYVTALFGDRQVSRQVVFVR